MTNRYEVTYDGTHYHLTDEGRWMDVRLASQHEATFVARVMELKDEMCQKLERQLNKYRPVSDCLDECEKELATTVKKI